MPSGSGRMFRIRRGRTRTRRGLHEYLARIGAVVIVALVVGVALPSSGASASTYGGPGRIAYVGVDPSGYSHIWTMTADGTDKVDLMPSSTDLNDDPSWAPDGSAIAFSRGPTFGKGDIWRMDPDGGNPVQLTTDPAHEIRPSWSPDGSTIVFEAGAKIATISALDGSNRTVIGKGDAPSYSPNGRRIVFARYKNGYSDIFVMKANGSDVTNLTKTPSISEFLPDWSADGGTIAFQRSHGDHDIWTMRPDGSIQYLITRNTAFDGYPSFSPEGTRFVLVRDDAVITMNASGSGAKTLVPASDVASFSTDWQPLLCTISGTGGDDELIGTSGDDVICGLGGNDILDGLGGNDTLLGGPGRDTMYGRGGDDILAGAAGSDLLVGNAGNDRLTGDGSKDILKGGAGDDYLFAWDRAGGDRLICGTGNDRYAYERNDIVKC